MIQSLVLALLQFILVTYITFREYHRKSISIFLWGMLWLLFGLMHCVTILGTKHTYPLWVYDRASLFVILFCCIYLLTRLITDSSNNTLILKNSSDADGEDKKMSGPQKRFVYITFYILVFCVIHRIYALTTFSGGLLNSSWSSGRALSATYDYFNSNQVITCLYFYSSSSILIFWYWGKRKMAVISGALVLFQVICSRNRIEVLPILVSVIAYIILTGTKLSFKRIIQLGLVGIFSVFLIYALHIFRHYGSIGVFLEDFELKDFFNRIVSDISTGKGDIGLRECFYYFIYHNNEFPNFGKLHTYIRMLLVALPTSWSGGLKPPDFAISMGTAMHTYVKGFSTHPTLFGDCYANLGFGGIFLSVFWALFIKLSDKIITRQDINLKLSLIVLYGSEFLIIGRGSAYNSFVFAFWGTILMFIIHYILNKSKA